MPYTILMRIDEATKGTKVRVIGEPDVGTVDHIDFDDRMVWVSMPIPGHDGQTDLIDVDPEDLELAS